MKNGNRKYITQFLKPAMKTRKENNKNTLYATTLNEHYNIYRWGYTRRAHILLD